MSRRATPALPVTAPAAARVALAAVRAFAVLAATAAFTPVALTLMLALALALLAPSAQAVTFAQQDYVCPLDGRPFTQGLPVSGRALGSRLDLKPWGPVVAPAVLPVCPGSRFVVWKHHFEDAELARLRQFVATPEWQAIQDTESDYFRVARLREAAGDDAIDVAFTWLYATWEVDELADRYPRYADLALQAVDRALAPARAARDERTPTLELVALELERRLGRREPARRRLQRLSATEGFTQGLPARVLAQQRRLLDAGDTDPHRIDADASAAATPSPAAAPSSPASSSPASLPSASSPR